MLHFGAVSPNLLTMEDFQFAASIRHILWGHDRIAIENRTCLPAANLHGYFLGDTSMDERSSSASPQVVKNHAFIAHLRLCFRVAAISARFGEQNLTTLRVRNPNHPS